MVVSWHNKKIGSNKIINIISDISDSLKVVRIDLSDSKNMLVAQVTLDKDLSVDTFIDRVLTLDPKSSVQIYESNTNF